MIVKMALLVGLFTVSLFWHPAGAIFCATLCLFVIAEFSYKSFYYMLFFIAWTFVLGAFFYIALSVFAAVCVVKIIFLESKTEIKKIGLIAFALLLLLTIILVPPIGADSGWLFINCLLILICCFAGNKIGFKDMMYWYILGLIVSCLFGLLNIYVQFIPGITDFYSSGIRRFSGILSNPNHLHIYTLAGISGLLVLNLKKKIRQWEFFTLFTVLSVFGFMTVARTFYLAYIIAIIVYTCLFILRDRKKSIKPLAISFAIIIVVGLCLYKYTGEVIQRAVHDTLDEIWHFFNSQNSDSIYPGRLELWALYIKDWLSSPGTFLFGRGLDSQDLAGTMPHNILINIVAKTGLVGLVLFAFFLFSMFYTLYKTKKVKFEFAPFLILITLFFTAMFDLRFPHLRFFLFIFFFVTCVADNNIDEINAKDDAVKVLE